MRAPLRREGDDVAAWRQVRSWSQERQESAGSHSFCVLTARAKPGRASHPNSKQMGRCGLAQAASPPLCGSGNSAACATYEAVSGSDCAAARSCSEQGHRQRHVMTPWWRAHWPCDVPDHERASQPPHPRTPAPLACRSSTSVRTHMPATWPSSAAEPPSQAPLHARASHHCSTNSDTCKPANMPYLRAGHSAHTWAQLLGTESLTAGCAHPAQHARACTAGPPPGRRALPAIAQGTPVGGADGGAQQQHRLEQQRRARHRDQQPRVRAVARGRRRHRHGGDQQGGKHSAHHSVALQRRRGRQRGRGAVR